MGQVKERLIEAVWKYVRLYFYKALQNPNIMEDTVLMIILLLAATSSRT